MTSYHVMLLSEIPKANGAKVYAHENNRCDEFVEINIYTYCYYRIEE